MIAVGKWSDGLRRVAALAAWAVLGVCLFAGVCLNEWAAQGLRLIEVDKADLPDLPDIMALVAGRPEKFIIGTSRLRNCPIFVPVWPRWPTTS